MTVCSESVRVATLQEQDGGSVDSVLCVFRLLWSLRGGVLPAVLQPVALAIHLQDVDVVGEPVQQRAGEPFRAEHVGPFVEGQVGGHQDGAPIAALAEDLEEQFRSDGRPGHVAQFVDDQQAEAGQIPLQVEQRYLIPDFQRSALHRFHRRDASARFPSRGSPTKEPASMLTAGL